ncbi:hypothetical protein [Bosea sp. (in: a-proteobacteria)]|uniref:hypothetical protein n=1 Tax=Bosea sp. (in: a-proteobacteria) TaxID=1871050 RepID=UPI0035232910
MTLSKVSDGPVLPRKLARQCVDFRLTLCRQRRKGRAIAFQHHACSGCVASHPALAPALQRDQSDRPTRDLSVDQLELALDLPARLLHASELRQRLRKDRLDDVLCCQPMKLDGPA